LGQLVVQAGPLMAASDRFEISITGRGGHGAVPEDTIDAVLVGAEVVSAMQSIVSRNVSPHETAVLTIGSFRAGNAFNVIAEQARLEGTIRTFNPAVRALILRRMQEMLAGIAAAHGARAIFDLKEEEYTPAVINDARMADIARQAAAHVLPEEQITQIRPLMVSEDMSEVLNRVPGCYVLLGAEPEEGALGSHHNPKFDINEEALPIAAAIMASIAATFNEQQTGKNS
jgi:amidohydrolase